MVLDQLKLETTQQDAPQRLDLQIGKGHPEAAMLAAAEGDEREAGFPVLNPARSEALRIEALRLGENLWDAV